MIRRVATVLLAAAIALTAALSFGRSPVSAEPGGAVPGSPRGAADALAVGDSHACALRADGRVVCWGWGGARLGLGDTQNRGDEPGEVEGLSGVDLPAAGRVVGVRAGSATSCALFDSGALACWGANANGELGLGDTQSRGDGLGEMGANLPLVDLGGRVVDVSIGSSHSCAVLGDGRVKCWGSNAYGQLGLGDTEIRGDGPGEMGETLPAVDLGAGRTAVAISADNYTSCAILDDGAVKCWGAGSSGRLGTGDSDDRGDGPGEMGDALLPVDLGAGRTALSVAAGGAHSCAVLDDRSVKCWGNDYFGSLGQGDVDDEDIGDDPGELGDALPAVRIGTGRTAAGVALHSNTCILRDNGTIVCLGYGPHGDLGTGQPDIVGTRDTDLGDALVAVRLPAPARAVGLGGSFACALLTTRQVTCWGWNAGGQLGVGHTESIGDEPSELPPAPVPLTNDTEPIVGAPAPPTGVVAEAAVSAVRVSWQAPGDDGGAAVSGYHLEQSADGKRWLPVATSPAVATASAVVVAAPGSTLWFRVRAVNVRGASPWSSPSAPATALDPSDPGGPGDPGGPPAAAGLITLAPARLLDTRPGGATADGDALPGAAVASGTAIEVRVAGRGGVPADAAAAILNVTAVGPTAAGYATVYPCGRPPNASNLNYQAAQDIANLVLAKLSPQGTVCVYSSATTDVLVDVGGFAPAGSSVTTLDPARLLDTRSGGATVDGEEGSGGRLPTERVRRVQIAGRGGVPSNAAAAVLNVTAVGPSSPGYVTVFPCGDPPNASNLNVQAGEDIPNAVVAKLDGHGGVCLTTSTDADVLIDVNGFVLGDGITPLAPGRLLDTRDDGETIDGERAGAGTVAAGTVVEVPVAGRGGVPTGATTAILNVTAVGPAAAGYATVFACGELPNASNLNVQAGEDIPNAVVAKLGPSGSVCVFTSTDAHYLVDVAGFA